MDSCPDPLKYHDANGNTSSDKHAHTHPVADSDVYADAYSH
jgi:hypothetical protein